MKTVKIGTVLIDSACLIIADPANAAQVAGEFEDRVRNGPADDFLIRGEIHPVDLAGQPGVSLGALGVVCDTGMGDGPYEVTADVDEDCGAVQALHIDFRKERWGSDPAGKHRKAR